MKEKVFREDNPETPEAIEEIIMELENLPDGTFYSLVVQIPKEGEDQDLYVAHNLATDHDLYKALTEVAGRFRSDA